MEEKREPKRLKEDLYCGKSIAKVLLSDAVKQKAYWPGDDKARGVKKDT